MLRLSSPTIGDQEPGIEQAAAVRRVCAEREMVDWNALSRRSLLGVSGATVAVAGAAFALRGSGGVRTRRSDPKTFYRGNRAEPDSLDPHLATSQYEYEIVGDMFVGLMTENAA